MEWKKECLKYWHEFTTKFMKLSYYADLPTFVRLYQAFSDVSFNQANGKRPFCTIGS